MSTFSDDDLKRLEERMNRIVTLWDSERKDHIGKCRTLDIAFREATEVFNSLMPLLARLEAAEEAYFDHAKRTDKPCPCLLCDKYRKAVGK